MSTYWFRMSMPVKFSILIVVSVAGFYASPILSNLAVMFGLFPDVSGMDSVDMFNLGYFGGIMWAWVLASLIGLGYLFSEGPKRFWFLWAPLYTPVLYAIGALAYFSS